MTYLRSRVDSDGCIRGCDEDGGSPFLLGGLMRLWYVYGAPQ